MRESKFLLGDCMNPVNGLPAYPDNYFDLAIVDPPYGIVSQQKRGIGSRIDATGKMNGWNYNKPNVEYFLELFRVSKFQIVWGANNFEMPPSEYFVVWYKKQTVENFASAEYAWANYPMPAKVATFTTHQMIAERTAQGGKIHPTQKPVALYRWLLENYAKPGDLILDTHVGSASSLIACESMGFDYVGFEIDPDYYAAAKNRMGKGIQLVIQ